MEDKVAEKEAAKEMLPTKLPSLRSYTMGWPVGTAAGGTTMEVN